MKSKFNKNWNKSKQPRKQRKFLANAPSHIKYKLLSSSLDKSLKEKLKRNSLELRKNDEVKVMRGKYTKKQGKILKIDKKNTRIQIDGITISKKDGEKSPVWFHPSNLKIIKIEDTDKKRIKEKSQTKKQENTTNKKTIENKKQEEKETNKKSITKKQNKKKEK